MNPEYKFQLVSMPKKGTGLITTSYIPKGTIIYEPAKDENNFKLEMKRFERYLNNFLTYEQKKKFLTYSYIIDDWIYFPKDLNRLDPIWFINHSNFNNTICNKEGKSITIRSIYPGQEITENYADYDYPFIYNEMCKRYLHFEYPNIIKTWN